MSDTRWDKPSDTLRRMAEGKISPHLRACLACDHRHAKGELCAWPYAKNGLVGAEPCACTK